MTAQHLAPFVVTISDCKTIATMAVKTWRIDCATTELPKWLRFYRQLRDRSPRTAHIYERDVVAIEEAMKALGMDTTEPAKKRTKP
jgi:hypothetical protein